MVYSCNFCSATFSTRGNCSRQHCLIPKLFINAIASLPEKTEPAECSLITSGGHLPPKALPTFQHFDMESIPNDVKRILFRYDCDCVPLFENQLGAYQA